MKKNVFKRNFEKLQNKLYYMSLLNEKYIISRMILADYWNKW